jgi:CBS domain-containing protein
MKTVRPTLQRTVGDIMTRSPVTLPPGARIWQAARLFRDERPAAIGVVDSAGTLCGIVTMLDLLRAAAPREGVPAPSARSVSSRTLETVMRPGVITLEASDTVGAALDLLIETRFHALPVVRRYGHGPELIGMLEQRDLVPMFAGRSPRALGEGDDLARHRRASDGRAARPAR